MAANNLCSLEEIKEFYGFTGSQAEDDDLIETLIERVTYDFQNYCGIDSFLADDYVEYVDGNGSRYLFVKNTPINSVASIYEDPDWVWSASSEISSDDYLVNSNYILYKDIWSAGLSNYKVSYNGGYTEIPLDLKQCAIEEILKKYKRRKDFDVANKSLSDGSALYFDQGYLSSTFRILSRYRAMRAH